MSCVFKIATGLLSETSTREVLSRTLATLEISLANRTAKQLAMQVGACTLRLLHALCVHLFALL